MPNPSTFPFTGVTFNVRGGEDIVFDASDMHAALQYSPTGGVPVSAKPVCERDGRGGWGCSESVDHAASIGTFLVC
jgi:hypothetical protein